MAIFLVPAGIISTYAILFGMIYIEDEAVLDIMTNKDVIERFVVRLSEFYTGLFENFDRMLLLDLKHGSEAGFLGPLAYSTLFTSVWMWMFAISNLVIKLINFTFPAVKFIKYALPVDEKPFRSIGILAAMISTVFYWVVCIFYI